ncbi:hypothetical protein [Rhodovarius lipocyclicus]|uniref:hypothetical protein n=1 Tax=Rhodovarius lipocyclicus TaxID=268410 RepID=UPI001356D4AC|nr:hypothetical protein [Rhodovarius lipocyclicus]
MARIPIHYDSFMISNGLKGSERANVGRIKHHTLVRDADDMTVSAYDHHIARLTNIVPGDVSTFRTICLEWRIVVVVRNPGVSTLRAGNLGIGVTGKPEEDKQGLKVGNDVVRRANGELIVGDYDLMSVWAAEGHGYEKIEFTRDGSGHGAKWTNPEAERLFLRFNASLTIKLEHGANDDWKTDNPIYQNIRNNGVIGHRSYVAFTDTGDYKLLGSPGALKSYYLNVLKVDWPYSV